LALCLALAQRTLAASAANDHVTVACEAPGVSVSVAGNHFDVFAPGYPDFFITNVMVEGRWHLGTGRPGRSAITP